LKVFENMAVANPVITTPLGHIDELVEDNVNGLLLQNNTEREIIDEVLDLASSKDKREEFGKNAKKFIEAHYSWDTNAKKIENAILENKQSPSTTGMS